MLFDRRMTKSPETTDAMTLMLYGGVPLIFPCSAKITRKFGAYVSVCAAAFDYRCSSTESIGKTLRSVTAFFVCRKICKYKNGVLLANGRFITFDIV